MVEAQISKQQERLFMLLAGDENEWVRKSVIKNPACTIRVLDYLVGTETNSYNLAAIAAHRNLSVKGLRVLAKGEKFSRSAVAANPNSPQSLLIDLSTDEDHWVRQGVAGNPSAPMKALTILSEDDNDFVVIAVAKHSAVSKRALGVLAVHRNPAVRYWVARHSSTPDSVLKALAVDEEGSVRQTVAAAVAANTVETVDVEVVAALQLIKERLGVVL